MLENHRSSMEDEALFNLRWDAQRSALLGSVASLYREEAFVDTTIVADDKIFKAHKLLLSASSSYLKHILESVPSSQHAVIFMPHIGATDLGNVLKFIYDGEIKINRRSLKSFLSVAKLLKIKGMDFELEEDLDANNSHFPTNNPSSSSASTITSSQKRFTHDSNPTQRPILEQEADKSPSSNSSRANLMANLTAQIKENIRSAFSAQKDDENLVSKPSERNQSTSLPTSCQGQDSFKPKPAPVSDSGRSTESLASPISTNNNAPSPRESRIVLPPASIIGDEAPLSTGRSTFNGTDGSVDENSNHSDCDDNSKALNLHMGRFNQDNDSEDMDHHSRTGDDERDDQGLSIPDPDMDNDFDDDDDDDPQFSISMQPEVSLRESDESFNIHDRNHLSAMQFKMAASSFANSLCLPFLTKSAMSITPSPGVPSSSSSYSSSSPMSTHQQMSLKHLSKLTRPIIPKLEQGSPLVGQMAGINEGILMRMMREPLQGVPGGGKPMGSPTSHGSFFDIAHGDGSLHPSGLRKQKRYVQCTSCSKVLSSLSALKRHMEDVHCARIQGKCLLCGRVYSSRNSLLTHVYSAHKKHHDYKAVARIIRESDFEQFATA